MEFLRSLFDASGFPRRWSCGTWSDALGWTHVLADLATWGAYTAIPLVLAYFVLRRKDTPFPKIFLLFACFIFACGTVHLIEAMIFWWPIYRFSGAVKVATALVSWATVLALIPATPKALALPGLAKVNAQLEGEIRERRAAEEAMRESETRLRAVVDSAGEGIITVGPAGEVITFNPAAERIFERSSASVLGSDIAELIPQFHTFVLPAGESATNGSVPKPQRAEGRHNGGGGFPLELTVAPSSVADQPVYICVVRDVTDRSRMEEQQNLLMAELSHRVKNTLATVQAIAMQTMQYSEGLPAFQIAFEGRLQALSHAHNLLTAGKWEGIGLREIVERELAPHGGRGRFTAKGPAVILRPKAALAVHMALHELATNAAKYGGLSCESGRVHVQWEIRPRGTAESQENGCFSIAEPKDLHGQFLKADRLVEQMAGNGRDAGGAEVALTTAARAELELTWSESGGPAVTAPGRRGFGTQLIRTAIEYELEGGVVLDYRPDGLVGRFVLPWQDEIGYVVSENTPISA